MFLLNFKEGEECDTGKETNLRSEEDVKDPDQHNSIPEFTKNENQDAIDRLKKKKEKQKTAVEYEPNSSKIAVMLRNKNQNHLQ